MPEYLADYQDLIYESFGLCSNHILQVGVWMRTLGTQIAAENWGSAQFACEAIADEIEQIDYTLTDSYDGVNGWLWEALYYIDDNVPWDAGEITWESIVEAWMKNDFEGRVWTIGVIDRMRQIMWDEPFNLTFAARPEQQEHEWE